MPMNRMGVTARTQGPARRRRLRPAVEPLEDRSVPATFTVTTLLDSADAGDGLLSLREAIAAANATIENHKITFGVTGTINLAGELPHLNTLLDIAGPGADRLTVRRDAGGDYSVFTVAIDGPVTLSGLTIANGRAAYGGGLYSAYSADVRVDRCAFTGNTALQAGGGLFSLYDVIVRGSTFSGNTAVGQGGGIFSWSGLTAVDCTFAGNAAASGGGLYNGGDATVVGSTFSGNAATFEGGGIANEPGSGFGLARVLNCTLTGNSAPDGGGILNSTFLELFNSIVANSPSGADVSNHSQFDLVGSANVIESGNSLSGLTNTMMFDPLLGPLQDNGGPARTHALLPASPAIDAGDRAALPADDLDLDGDGNRAEILPFDQRGAGYPRTTGGLPDVGAVEDSVLAFTAGPANGTDRLTLLRSDSDLELLRNGVVVASHPLGRTHSVAVRGADGEADGLTIDFSAGAFAVPGGISFAGGSGAPADRIAVRADADMTLADGLLTVRGDGVSLSVTLTGVEAAELTGGVGDNSIDAAGFAGPVTLSGGSGDDELTGGPGRDRVRGGTGDDRLTGGPGNDRLDGGTGSDALVEAGDVDLTLTPTRLTGLGSDALSSLEAAELTGGDGDNVLLAGKFAGPVVLDGGAGDDVLVGGASDDLLLGSAGRDVLIGGRGADDLDGGAGDDVLVGGSTALDRNPTALTAVRAEWAGGTGDYATRVGRLRGTIAGGANGAHRLTARTVKSDAAENVLAGGLGQDWFLAKATLDDATDRDLGGAELVTGLA